MFVLFPDEGHGWRKEANRVRSTLALTRFFRAHLIDAKRAEAESGGTAAK